MNICIVNYREINPYIGGVERVSYVLAEQWIQQGHNLFFLSLVKSNIQSNYVPICKEYFLPNANWAVSKENINYFLELLDSNKIDIILNQGSVFPDLCELCKIIRINVSIPLITTIHYAPLCKLIAIKNNFFIREKLGRNLKLWLSDILLYIQFFLYKQRFYYKQETKELCNIASFSDKLVCLSNKFIPEYLGIIGNIFSHKIVAIPNPIDLDLPQNNLPKKKQIIYVGRLEFGMKRIDRLIKIWERTEKLFPDWKFIIVGNGPMLPRFREMAHSRHLERIHFADFQNPEKYYLESSIICLSSSTEGFGMVLIEAMKYQCIPIAYDSFSALSDIIVNNINGYSIPPFKKNIYLQKLHYLMRNNDERTRLASNHTITLNKFDLKTVSLQWISLFNSILK